MLLIGSLTSSQSAESAFEASCRPDKFWIWTALFTPGLHGYEPTRSVSKQVQTFGFSRYPLLQ